MKTLKKPLSLLMALFMCLGMFAGTGVTAFAAGETMTTYMVDIPRANDPNKAGWGHPALNFLGGWSTSAGTHFSVHTQDAYNGRAIYCIEPGIGVHSGDQYTGRGEDFWDNYPSSLNPTIPPNTIKEYIGRIMTYGWQGNASTSWMSSNPDHANQMAGYIATQLLVWETIVGERDSQFNHVDANAQGKNNVTEYISAEHPLRSQIFSQYSAIESAVKRHTMLPSFFSSTADAGAYELKWDGEKYSATLTDTNGVLGDYTFSSSTAGLNFSVDGSQLTITSSQALKGSVTVKAEKISAQRSGVVVWTDGVTGGGTQDFATYGTTVSDQMVGYLNLEVKTGNMKLIKTSEDGKVEGISFTITGEGYNATKTTNAAGEIDITDLNPGVYTVTEQSIDKYEPQATQRVTIVSGQTATVTFNNVLKRGSLEVTKTSEDGLAEGMTFHLSGTSLSGLPVDEYAVTDSTGVARFENVLIGTGYVLEEVDTPIRYVVPEAQTATIEWNEVTDKTVNNILKKFRVTVTKSDVETGTPQGDGSLAGATYGLYKGDTLIDSFTTDENGQFTTGYYVCDSDWTIREINPSEGYLVDSTIHHVGAEPELYTIELNDTANDVTEQIIKGDIAIIKHTDDGETGIETPEEGAEFQIYLKAAGSYDAAKDSERDVLVCDENGFAQSKKLPYGTYIVHQTKGWEGRELMDDFEVYISQDGQTYRYLINNAAFESYIKVVKVDAETGVTIPYAGAGFQIYRPDGSKVEMTFTYPTPTTIDTFYTNAEGYLVTPEKLEYGSGYSLVEVQAPYGYVLDSTPVYFDVTEDNSTEEGGVTVIEVTKSNMAQKGVIKVSKTGEVFSSVQENEGVYQPVYEVTGLPGAVFEITALEDVYTPDGTLRYSAGEVVDTITTGEDGTAQSQPLYLGKFQVKEIEFPHGMADTGENITEVELVYAGQEVEITETSASFYNQRQLYPSANILVATKKDFETQNRKKFCSRIATGDYDAVIIGHSQFEKIPMSAERQQAILQQQIDEILFGIEQAKAQKAERYTVKQMERTRKSLEAKLEKLNDQSRKDDVVTFEQLGVDRLFVDESHYFKNLFLMTKMRNVGGIAQTEAQKSSDLFMKCRYLDELTGGRGTIFATGTPISNSMVELYTIQRYLQYGLLQEMGLIHFDDWASDFGETITAIELSPEGTGYRAKTRFAKFFNLPELMAAFKQVADIQTADMLHLPVPKANFHTEVIKPSELQQEMVKGLAERAEKIRDGGVDPHVDNMLRITNDGRKLALDMRLINPLAADDPNGKVAVCARNVYKIWEQTKEQRSTQLVFCDLSTPTKDGSFNVYDDLKKKLMEQGIPEDEIAFIHDADSEVKKKALFAKVRAGQIRVLMGSTQKMGAGTNVQDRLIALHDLDCPWRPSDLQQRLGRIVRQGNENEEVEIFRYVTEGTFDAYLYQLVENKQKFIAQIMTSKAPVRVAEDVDETALSYSEIKALATGNPLIIEKCNLDMEVAKLNMLKASYLNQRYSLEELVLREYPADIARITERIAGYEKDVALAAAHPKGQEGFCGMVIEGKQYAEKEDAGKAIIDVCSKMTGSDAVLLGEYRGFSMVLAYDGISNEYRITLKGTLSHTVTLGADVFGNIARLDNALENLAGSLQAEQSSLEETKGQLENARAELGAPFAREEELAEKTARLNELNVLLKVDEKDKTLIDSVPDEGEEVPERKVVGLER